MHPARQFTSLTSQAFKQAASEDSAGVRETEVDALETVVVATSVLEELSVVWALAKTAKAPKRMVEKRIFAEWYFVWSGRKIIIILIERGIVNIHTQQKEVARNKSYASECVWKMICLENVPFPSQINNK